MSERELIAISPRSRKEIAEPPLAPTNGVPNAKNGGPVWWPYQTLAQVMLQTQRDASALMAANREFQDDIRRIHRREHELAMDLLERVAAERARRLQANANATLAETEEIFERAIDYVRDLGGQLIEAQVRALETMLARASHHRVPEHQKASEVELPAPRKKTSASRI